MQAGQTERVILRKLAATDPEGRRHIIRLLSHFEFRGHLCLVFEPMVCIPFPILCTHFCRPPKCVSERALLLLHFDTAATCASSLSPGGVSCTHLT